jgi:hypothetical protein
MAVSLSSNTMPTAARVYFGNFSNKNVTIKEIPPSVDNAFLYSFAAQCKVCDKHELYHHNHDYYGEFLTSGVANQLKSFCEQHRHKEEGFFEVDESFNITKKKNPILFMKPGALIPVDDKEDIEFKSMFEINIGGRRIESATLPPDVLKQVYKLSNFNVDLQAKVSNGVANDYRAICNKCGLTCSLDYEQLRSCKDVAALVELRTFCSKHRHDTLVEDRVGRKFRVD